MALMATVPLWPCLHMCEASFVGRYTYYGNMMSRFQIFMVKIITQTELEIP